MYPLHNLLCQQRWTLNWSSAQESVKTYSKHRLSSADERNGILLSQCQRGECTRSCIQKRPVCFLTLVSQEAHGPPVNSWDTLDATLQHKDAVSVYPEHFWPGDDAQNTISLQIAARQAAGMPHVALDVRPGHMTNIMYYSMCSH